MEALETRTDIISHQIPRHAFKQGKLMQNLSQKNWIYTCRRIKPDLYSNMYKNQNPVVQISRCKIWKQEKKHCIRNAVLYESTMHNNQEKWQMFYWETWKFLHSMENVSRQLPELGNICQRVSIDNNVVI